MKVYLIRAGKTEFYKIGVSKNPKTRVDQLQTGHNETLLLVNSFETKYGFKTENFVHRKYASQNVQLEWFELTDEQVKRFKEYCEQAEATFLLLEEQNTYLQDKNFF